MEVYKPIIIIGLERSGTTFLYSLLANHPDLYWFSRLDSLIPNQPILSSFIRRIILFVHPKNHYLAIRGTISRSRGLIPPSECIPCWKSIFKWGTENDYIIEDDYFDESFLTPDLNNALKADLVKRLKVMKKKRMLFKQSGLSLRLKFLNALFPDAIFLHIIRHPISHLDSLIRAKKRSKEKFWGTKVPGWKRLIDADLPMQAAYQMKMVSEIIDQDIRCLHDIKKRYIVIKFEILLSKPQDILNEVLNFCDLPVSKNMEKIVIGLQAADSSIEKLEYHKAIGSYIEPLISKYDY